MQTRKRTPGILKLALITAVTTALVVVGLPGTAGAHHPEIVAEVECTDVITITYITEAWEDDRRTPNNPNLRHNNLISITVDGVEIATGAFTPENNFMFSGSFQAEPGKTYTIRSTAMVRWGVNEDVGQPGEWREVTVEAPLTWDAPPTTTPPTTTAPGGTTPSTTVAPSGSTPTTTIPTDVEGEITESSPAQPVPGQPEFTG